MSEDAIQRASSASIDWRAEHRGAHERLRDAFASVRASAEPIDPALRLHWQGFFVAAIGHLSAEDGTLFPALRAQQPEVAAVLDALELDHRTLTERLASLDQYLVNTADPVDAAAHLDELRAHLFFHFLQEEARLGDALGGLGLDARPEDVLGPL